MDLDVDEPAAVRRGQGRPALAPGRLAVLPLAGRQDAPLAAVGRQVDDLEPTVGIGRVEEAPVGHRPGTGERPHRNGILARAAARNQRRAD